MKLAVQKNIATYLICVTLLAITTIGLGILIYNVNKKDDNNGTNPSGDHVQASTTYNIEWRQYNGTLIMSTPAEKGTLLSTLAPEMKYLQIPADNAQYDFIFGNWSKDNPASFAYPFTDADKVTEPARYYVAYDATLKSYDIKFKIDINDDEEIDDVNETIIVPSEYGKVPTEPTLGDIKEELMSRDEPLQFVRWDKKVSAVTGEATYTAITEPVHYFTVKYTAGDSNVSNMPEDQDQTSDPIIATEKIYTVKYTKVTTENTETFTNRYDARNRINEIKDQENITMDGSDPYYTVSYPIPAGLPAYSGVNPVKNDATENGIDYYYIWKTKQPWIATWNSDNTMLSMVPDFRRYAKEYTVVWVDGDGNKLHTESFVNNNGDIELTYSGPAVPPREDEDDNTSGYIFNGQWTFTHIVNGATDEVDLITLETNGIVGNTTATAQYRSVCKDLYDLYISAGNLNTSLKGRKIDDLLQVLYWLPINFDSNTGDPIMGDPNTLDMISVDIDLVPGLRAAVLDFFLKYA